MRGSTILVVEADDDERRQMSAWLEGEGYDVMFCPGPAEPDYTCLGGRGLPCPLAQAADVVVIDLTLRSDAMMTGTPGWMLMLYYYEMGKRIVAISNMDAPVQPRPEDSVSIIRRPYDRETFLSTLRRSVLLEISSVAESGP